MFTKRNLLVIVFAIAALLIVGASGILAQSTDDDTPPYGPMGMHGGMMHGGMMHGGMMHDGMMHQNWSDSSMHTAIAEALGLDVDTLTTELQSGKTLAELADEHNVNLQTVYDAALAELTDHLNAAVEAGTLTQEQADAHLSYMTEHIGEMPMLDGGGSGHCSMCEEGMMGMMGMMGNGMGMGNGTGTGHNNQHHGN